MITAATPALPAHCIVCPEPIPWELAHRPDPDSCASWTILHPLATHPAYCDVTGPAYLRVRYVLDQQIHRHFILLPYAAAWRIRPVGRILENLPPAGGPAGGPPRPAGPRPPDPQGADPPMSTHPTSAPSSTPGTILVSLAVSDRGEFWKKTELSLSAGATEAEVAAALDQAMLMHARLATHLYGPVPLPPDSGEPVLEHEASAGVPPASTTPLTTTRPVAEADLATEKQVKAIYAIGRNARHMSAADVAAYCAEQFQGRKPNQLSKREASTLIDRLQTNPAA